MGSHVHLGGSIRSQGDDCRSRFTHFMQTRGCIGDVSNHFLRQTFDTFNIHVRSLWCGGVTACYQAVMVETKHPRQIAVSFGGVQIHRAVGKQFDQSTAVLLSDSHMENMCRASAMHRDQNRGGVSQRNLLRKGQQGEVLRGHFHIG